MHSKLIVVLFIGLIAYSAALPAKKKLAFHRLARYSTGHSARSTQAEAAVAFVQDANEPAVDVVVPTDEEVISEVGVAAEEGPFAVDEVPPVVTQSAVYLDVDTQSLATEAPIESDVGAADEPDEVNDVVPEEEQAQPEVPQEAAVPVEGAVVPVSPVSPARRVPYSAQRPQAALAAKAAGEDESKTSPQAGTYFPLSFGESGGSAIAIANSFSNAKGGSATSHAIAYGSQQPARTRIRQSS